MGSKSKQSRGRWKDYDSVTKDSYKEFKSKNPKIEVSFADYVKVLKTYNTFCWEDLLETGQPFKIPFGLGEIKIIKKVKLEESKEKPIDWNRTMALWKEDEEAREKKTLVRHLNAHTSGYTFSFFWNKGAAKDFSQSPIWALKLSRVVKRTLAKKLKSDSFYQEIYRLKDITPNKDSKRYFDVRDAVAMSKKIRKNYGAK